MAVTLVLAALVAAMCGDARAQGEPSSPAHHAAPTAGARALLSHTLPSEARDAAAAAKVLGIMRVTSVTGLHAAVDAGVPHIVIEEHLDLRTAATSADPPEWLFNLPQSVQSIQVRPDVPFACASAHICGCALAQKAGRTRRDHIQPLRTCRATAGARPRLTWRCSRAAATSACSWWTPRSWRSAASP